MDLRNFRDFLQLYNTLSLKCFKGCIDSLNSRTLEAEEAKCVDQCADKYIKFNRRFMGIYIENQQNMNNKRNEEAERKNQEAASSETVQNNETLEDKSDIPEGSSDSLQQSENSVPSESQI